MGMDPPRWATGTARADGGSLSAHAAIDVPSIDRSEQCGKARVPTDRGASPLQVANPAIRPDLGGASLDSAMEVALKGASGGFGESRSCPVVYSMKRLSGCSANSARRNPANPETCHNSPTRLIVAPRFAADGQSAFPACHFAPNHLCDLS